MSDEVKGEICSNDVSFSWLIENARHVLRSTNLRKGIYSPVFKIDPKESWQLKLVRFVSEDVDFLKCHLKCHKTDYENEKVSFNFYIFDWLNKQWKQWNELDFNQYSYERDTVFEGRDMHLGTLLCPDNNYINNNQFQIQCEILYDVNDKKNVLKLSKDFGKLYKVRLFSDVKIIVQGAEYYAHKAVLSARCYDLLVKSGLDLGQEQNRYKSEIIIRNTEPDVFEEFLKYVYTGKVEKMGQVAKNLLKLAVDYDIVELKSLCQDHLAQSFTVDNVIEIFELAHNYEAKFLKAEAIKFIKLNGEKVTKTEPYKSVNLPAGLYKEIIQALTSNRGTKDPKKRASNDESKVGHVRLLNYSNVWAINSFKEVIQSLKNGQCFYSHTFPSNFNDKMCMEIFVGRKNETHEGHKSKKVKLHDEGLSLSLKRCKSDSCETSYNINFSVYNNLQKQYIPLGEVDYERCLLGEKEPIFVTQDFLLDPKNNFVKDTDELELEVLCEICSDRSDRIQFKICEDFKNLFESRSFFDVVLDVKGEEFPAHKSILAIRSSVFFNIFVNYEHENYEIAHITDTDPDVMAKVLSYIYSGKVDNIHQDASSLLKAANRYDLQDLKNECDESLANSVNLSNCIDMLKLSLKEKAQRLRSAARNFIKLHPEKVKETDAFKKIEES